MEKNVLAQELELGVASMDESHNELFNDIQRIQAVTDAEFAEFYESLVAKIERDFRSEELLMEDLEYDGLKAHREQHARVLGGLHHVAPRIREGDIAIGRKALELLPKWFLLHIGTMDRALAEAVQKADSAAKEVVSG